MRTTLKAVIPLIMLFFLAASPAIIDAEWLQQMIDQKTARPAGDFLATQRTERFAGSGICALCHSTLASSLEEDVSIDTHWRASMPSNSAADPFWQAKVISETQRTKSLYAVIEDKCANCHMPMAYIEAENAEETVKIQGKGFLDKNNLMHDIAMDGVSCTLCHQIESANLGEEESFTGGFEIADARGDGLRIAYGPFSPTRIRQMEIWSGYSPVRAPHIQEAALCGTCHNLYTPYTDEDGNVLGSFPEQTAHLEWLASSYAKGNDTRTCQDCHMPEAEGTVVVENNRGGHGHGGMQIERPDFNTHVFTGSNDFMQRLMLRFNKRLETNARDEDFEAAIERTLENVQKAVLLNIKRVRLSGNSLDFDIKLKNITGHKFPTGFPSRRAWLHVTVTDADGEVVFESGAVNDKGQIIGDDGDEDPESFEPHYDLITSEDQVQIYQAVMGDFQGDVTYTLLRGAEYLKDNRITPPGFRQRKAIDDIKPAGNAKKDRDFKRGREIISYSISTGGFPGPFTIDVELRYQSAAYNFIQDLKNDKGRVVRRFVRWTRKIDNSGSLVASALETAE